MAASARIDELKKRYEENQRRFFAPLANEYRKAGDLEQAIALCRMHLAEAPNNISGQIVFAQALYDAGTLDESRAAFETAIGLDPENLIALRHLGDIARASGDIPTARQWYQRVLDADRRNEEVLTLMEELNTLELSPPEAPTTDGTIDGAGDEPIAPSAAAPPMARSPMSSAASLTGAAPNLGSTTPTREIVGMARPKPPATEPAAAAEAEPVSAPEPERVTAPEPELAAAPEPPPTDEMGFGAAEAEPESQASRNAPDSSFGFDVDLNAAAQIPSYSDDSTSEFGVVELPVVSAFSDAESEPAPAQFEPMEMAYDAEVEATLEGAAEPTVELPVESPPDIPAEDRAAAELATVEMPSVLEYVEAPSAPSAPDVPPNEELLDFEMEAAAPSKPVPEPAFEAFELTTETTADEDDPPAAEEPAPARRASLESFDPIRHMPTPIAPMTAARTRSPVEASPPIVEETAPEPQPPEVPAEAHAPQEAFATETMAELYVQQGLRQEAIGVYHQLIAARPDDAGLRARLAELTGASRKPGGSTARAFFANLAGRRATPVRSSTVADAPVPRAPTPAFQPVVEPAAETAVAPVTEAAVEPVAEASAAAESAAEPPTAEFTDASAAESAAEAIAGSDAEPAEPDSGVTTAPATNGEPTSGVSPGGTLDALFGHTGVATPDNSAAQALAAAFASKPTPPTGRPTRAASDEFSLDRVFRKEGGTPAKGGLSVPRQSTSLRFDQFFTPPGDAPGDAPPTTPAADADGDSEQFQSWLSRLKKP